MKPSELLEQKGWTQGTYARLASGERCVANEPAAACYCMFGAIAAYAREQDKRYNFCRMTENLLHSIYGTSDIVGWNDTPGRTKEEVITVLKQVENELGL